MRVTKKTTYPSYLDEITTDVVQQDSNSQVLYRTHSFDKPESNAHAKKWRKDTIQSGNGPLHGLLPLCKLYYRVNESKIPATTRMGMKTRPLNFIQLTVTLFNKVSCEKCTIRNS